MIPPLENLKFWAGAGLVALVLSSSHLLDGPSEIEAAQATEAHRQDALNDALAAAQAAAEAKEAERREKDKAHKAAVNRAALEALVAGGISEADAKTVITLIAKKAVPAVTISY